MDKFGFGAKTGVDLSGEGKGIIFPLSKVGNVELATTAFWSGNKCNSNSPYCLINDTLMITRGMISKYAKKYDVRV